MKPIFDEIENVNKQAGFTTIKLDLRRRNRQEKDNKINMSIYEPEFFCHFANENDWPKSFVEFFLSNKRQFEYLSKFPPKLLL